MIQETIEKKLGSKSSQTFASGSRKFAKYKSQIFNSNSIDTIHDILNISADFDSTVYSAAIQKCGQLADVKFCIKIMELMHSRKVKPTVITFSTLFQAFKINRRMDCCDYYLKQMMDVYNIKPTIELETALLNGYANIGKVKMMEEIWENMVVKYDLNPDPHAYLPMIQIYGQTGNFDKSKQFYDQMIENGVSPNDFTKSAMMHAYIRVNRIHDALQIKNEIEQSGSVLSLSGYTPFIGFYLKDTQHFNPSMSLKLIEELTTDASSKRSQSGIKQFIMDELKSFNVDSFVDPQDKGQILLSEKDVKQYVKRHKNNSEVNRINDI